MHLSSFGHTFLVLTSGSASPRRCVRALLAARRRWPDGRLSIGWPFGFRGGFQIRWLVDGSCGVLITR